MPHHRSRHQFLSAAKWQPSINAPSDLTVICPSKAYSGVEERFHSFFSRQWKAHSGQIHAYAALPPGKAASLRIEKEAEWASELVWMFWVREKSATPSTIHNLAPPTAEDRNEWRCTSTPIWFHGMYRDKYLEAMNKPTKNARRVACSDEQYQLTVSECNSDALTQNGRNSENEVKFGCRKSGRIKRILLINSVLFLPLSKT